LTKDFHFLFRSKTKFWYKNAYILHEKFLSEGSNFPCGRPRGADPSSVRMRPPEPHPFLLMWASQIDGPQNSARH